MEIVTTPIGSLQPDHIDVAETVILRRWASELGCSEGQVIAAVMAVGPKVVDVKRHLCKV